MSSGEIKGQLAIGFDVMLRKIIEICTGGKRQRLLGENSG